MDFDREVKESAKGFLYRDTKLEDVEFTSQSIGYGGYANIYLAQTRDGVKLALKKFNIDAGEKDVDKIKRNIAHGLESGVLLSKQFTRPKIVPDLMSGKWYVMEFFDGQNVKEMIRKNPVLGENPDLTGRILATYADMLSLAHENELLFQDNSWGNVLVNGDEVRVCDYDLMHAEGSTPINSGLGTFIYGSREQILGIKLKKSSDLEGFALMMDHLINARPLRRLCFFNRLSTEEISAVNQRAESDSFNYKASENIPHGLREVLTGLIKYPRDDFITAEDVREAIRQAYKV